MIKRESKRGREEESERERERESGRGVHVQAECGGNDEECEEEQKPDGPEDSRNRRTGIRGSAVRYGTYGMVWYGTLMTVLAQNAGNRL